MNTEDRKIEEAGCAPVPSEAKKQHPMGGC